LSRFDRSKRFQPTAQPDPTTNDLTDSEGNLAEVAEEETTPNLHSVLYRKSFASTLAGDTLHQKEADRRLRKFGRHDSVATSQTKRIIRATGGASIPQNMENQSPAVPAAPSSTLPDPQEFGRRLDVAQARTITQSVPFQTRRPQILSAADAGHGRPVKRESALVTSTLEAFLEDEEEARWTARLARLLPPIPRLSELNLNPFRNRAYEDYSSATLDAWRDEDEESRKQRGLRTFFRRRSGEEKEISLHSKIHKDDVLTPSLSDLMDRCQNGRSVSLLTRADEKSCRSLGRTLAFLDVVKLASLLVIVRQISFIDINFSRSLDDLVSNVIPGLVEGFVDSWVPFTVVAAVLAAKTADLIRSSQLTSFLDMLEQSVGEEASYASLFLRVVSSSSLAKDTPDQVRTAARFQAIAKVERSRLRFFVTALLASLILKTVTVLTPLIAAGIHCLAQIAGNPLWRHVANEWRALLSDSSFAVTEFFSLAVAMIRQEFVRISGDPVKIFHEATIFLALLSLAGFPSIETRRKVAPVAGMDEEEEISEAHARFTEHVYDLGGSSASRLDILANGRAIESLLERWKFMQPSRPDNANGIASSSLLRILGYRVVTALLLMLPLISLSYAGIAPYGISMSRHFRWDSLLDLSVTCLFAHHIAGPALEASVHSKVFEATVSRLLSLLVGATDDRRKQLSDQSLNLQLQASLSPTAGILVKDLWAAHTTRRAWAVRGANLACKNGEIVLILGDTGSGKSRLLTTLAEAAVAPSRMALTSTRVRGSICFGGVEANKWEKSQLVRRLGLFLNDVRTVSDVARVLSGLAIEEVLEPSSGTRSLVDLSHSPGSSERNAMMTALRVTGLYSTLLPRLPSRLSTVVTANEEDLRPSTLRPRYYLLSSVEWSKLLLTRVLTQLICDNDNSGSSHEKVDQCLIGSFLILDDATAYFSEVDEARLMQDLRRTGAAVIMSSNRWAIGRFADKIAVLRDGAIVESGSHNELLNRGPQQSIYAARWHAMTSQ
jgi:ABC-type multidrug transport system fused ATPase/permease subunit